LDDERYKVVCINNEQNVYIKKKKGITFLKQKKKKKKEFDVTGTMRYKVAYVQSFPFNFKT
jgi:hypothetical protein